jgi:hypothetical protein
MPELAADSMSGAAQGETAPPAVANGPFVLNLCSSSTPMALAQTELAELKRFNFFVSRRFEEGRERFRLHMGYFATLAEAEEWLNVVREIYPGAWAGEAPGRKLRERAAAAAAAQAQHAAGPQPRIAPPVAQPAAPRAVAPAVARPAAPPAPPAGPPASVRVPVVHAAPPVAARAPALRATVALHAPTAPVARQAQPAAPVVRVAPAAPAVRKAASVARSAPAAPVNASARAAAPPRAAAPARVAAPAPARTAMAAAARPQPPAPRAGVPASSPARAARPALNDSNVREVLAALGETSATGETRLMQAPAPPRNAAAPAGASLTDTQVLRVLEDRRPDDAEKSPDAPASNIPLLKPDDTGTRRALKEAVVNNAPVWFAVQLQWSVQPVDLGKVPPLAIFSAYTLYTVEGSREGRRWYGLRLGFFSDAISAKQVAYYVRSEFGSVAVVPVSPQERGRATDDEKVAATLAVAPDAPRRLEPEEFKLIDNDRDLQLPTARPLAAKPGVKSPAPGRAPAAGRTRAPGRVGARERRGGHTLEETLEILGATQLSIEVDRGEIVNDTGVRHLQVEVQKNSPFSRLLERLSERAKKS